MQRSQEDIERLEICEAEQRNNLGQIIILVLNEIHPDYVSLFELKCKVVKFNLSLIPSWPIRWLNKIAVSLNAGCPMIASRWIGDVLEELIEAGIVENRSDFLRINFEEGK